MNQFKQFGSNTHSFKRRNHISKLAQPLSPVWNSFMVIFLAFLYAIARCLLNFYVQTRCSLSANAMLRDRLLIKGTIRLPPWLSHFPWERAVLFFYANPSSLPPFPHQSTAALQVWVYAPTVNVQQLPHRALSNNRILLGAQAVVQCTTLNCSGKLNPM